MKITKMRNVAEEKTKKKINRNPKENKSEPEKKNIGLRETNLMKVN